MTTRIAAFFEAIARNPVAPLPAPVVRKDADPALMTWKEYIRAINPKGKWHESHAYDWSMKQMNPRYNGELSESADPRNYKTLLRRVRANGIEFEYRLWRQEHPNGHVEFTIGIFNPQGERVGTAQDEWGAMLIAIAREYRGFGLAPLLTHFAYRFEPGKDTGGTTNAGNRALQTFHREAVREALTTGRYTQLVRERKMTRQRVLEIIRDVNLQDRLRPSTRDLGPSPRDKWIIYAEPEYGAFVLFDPKFKNLYNTGDANAEWAERMIYGAVNCFILHEKAVIVNLLGAVDAKAKRLMLALAASYAAGEKLPFYVDPDDMKAVDPNLFMVGVTDMVTGYRRTQVKIKKPLDLNLIGRASRSWLRLHDQYDELKNGILEVSHAKFRYNGVESAVLANVRLTIEEFMAGPYRNEYVRYKNLHSYLRKSKRVLDGKFVTVLERGATKNTRRQSNMVPDAKMQAKATGQYKEFDQLFQKMAAQYGFDAVFVELVHNEFLPEVLKRYSYKEMPKTAYDMDDTPSFYKWIDKKETKAAAGVNVHFPLGPNTTLETIQHEGVQLIYSVRRDGFVQLHLIRTNKEGRGEGRANSMLRQFLNACDAENRRVGLDIDSPKSEVGVSKAGLLKFYTRFGFKPNKGRSRDFTTQMSYIREPSAAL